MLLLLRFAPRAEVSPAFLLQSSEDRFPILDVVEKCFQSLKGVVHLRPIRHWLYNRVEAHIFICYLACLILSVLKEKVSPLGMSFQTALDELDGLYRVYLKDPKNNFKIDRLVALTKKQEEILKAVDRELLKKCSQ